MTPLAYFANIHEEAPGDFIVFFADVPEAITQGDTLAEAVDNAREALAVALEGYLIQGRRFPTRSEPDPSLAGDGYTLVDVPVDPVVAARGALSVAMADQGLSKVGLASRLGRDEKVVRRILSGKGASLELILEALRAVGIQPALAV